MTSTVQTKQTICIIDPSLTLRQRLACLLLTSTREVKTFESAENFLVKLVDMEPACIISGATLPGMGIVELIYQFKLNGFDAPVIVLGEKDDVPQAVSAMRAGAVDFIDKPFTDQKLLVSVKRMIESNSH
ncbi:MAG: response regulator [Gammaproteobacteria bacterium]|nr:response regulator [Gammaproteobacteria bacterium]